jgi:hypothetical protein
MYDAHDNTELFHTEGYGFSDSDIPEPVEHWSLEDFADVLQYA